MRPITDRISAGETLVCDGSIGTMLFEMGLEPGACPEEAVLSHRESPDFMAERVKELLEIGVSIVRGCCGTTPAHIRAFRAVVDNAAT